MKYAKSKILILSITFTMCMLFAVLMGNFSTAKAQVGLATNLTMQGASIRVEEPTGLRFDYSVDDYDEVSNANTNYGMLIVPYDYLADAGILEIVDGVDYVTVLKNAKQQSLINYDPIVVENIKPILVDGEYIVQHSIASIYPTNYNRSWFAIGFIKDGDSYIYSKVGDKNVRDILYVASTVLNKYYYDETFKTEKPEMYKQCKNNEDLLKAFVTKGIANVTDSLPYAIEGGKKAVWKGVDETLNLTVTQTKYVNLNTYWASSNTNVLTVDQNGKVTIVGEGSAKITAKSCELYSAEFTITVYDRQTETQDGEIAFVKDEADLIGYNAGGDKNVVNWASEDELGSILGDYNGNAIKYTIKQEYTHFAIKPRITEQEWENAVKNGFTKMYIWLAGKATIGISTLNIRQDGNQLLKEGEGFNLTQNQWRKVTFTLTEENKNILFSDNGAKIFIGYVWSITMVDGDWAYTAYIGDFGFDKDTKVQDSEITFVKDETSLSNYSLNQGQTSKTLATAEELATITGGDYKGNAVKFVISTQFAKVTMLPNTIALQWDRAVAEGYTKLYYYVATDSTTVQLQKGTDFLHEANKNLTQNTWTRFEIELTEEVKTKLFAEGGVVLYQVYNWGGSGHAVYIGDCGFDKETKVQEGEITFVKNETSLGNYSLNQGQTSKTLATAEELATITGGDYKGNAVKFVISTQYAKVTMLPNTIALQWDRAVAEGYTKLYFYVATDSTTVQLKTGTDFLHEANKNLTQNTWTRFEIELTEEVKTKMFASGGIVLYQVFNWGGSGHAVYIGDCGFDKETKVQEGEITFVKNETSLGNYSLNQGQTSKTLATAEELATITGGDYNGNAVKFVISLQFAKVTMLPNTIALQWDRAVAEGYTKLYYYVATNSTTVQLKTGEGFLHAGNNTLTQNTWTRFEIELTEEVKSKLFADGGVILCEVYNWGGANHAVYIGDCGFSK